jgi:hypothetical protein
VIAARGVVRVQTKTFLTGLFAHSTFYCGLKVTFIITQSDF